MPLFAEKFIKMQRHGSFLEKLQSFAEIVDLCAFSRIEPLFAEKFIETPKHGSFFEKQSIWPKLCNFSNKVSYLCISTNFSGKSYKKSLIS